MPTKTLKPLQLAVAQKCLDDYLAELANGDDMPSQEAAAYERRMAEGIESYKWIMRAEEMTRQAVYQGLIDFSPQLDEALEALYRGWLAPSNTTEAMAQHHVDQGVEVENLGEFRACCESARDWIERHEWAKASRRSRERRFASEPW